MAEQTIDQKTVTEATARKLTSLIKNMPKGTALKSYELARKPVYHIQNSQIAAGIIGTLGLIIFALGVENLIDSIPGLSSPFIEIGLGLILLLISGLFLKKLI